MVRAVSRAQRQLGKRPDVRAVHGHRLALEVATRSPDAVAASKRLLQQAWGASEHGALAAERRSQRSVIGRANQRAAVRGKLERSRG